MDTCDVFLAKVPLEPRSFVRTLAFPSVERIISRRSVSPLTLAERSVHLWGFSLAGSPDSVEQCRAWLSREELGRADRLVRPEHRIIHVLAHGGLRAVLARYAGTEPSGITFVSGPTGKPLLLDQQGRPDALKFNLSHSHGRMLIALAHAQEVGVDLEQVREHANVVKLAERFYAPVEYERIVSYAGFERVRSFYRYWVAKEAVLKGQAVGLKSLQQCTIVSSGGEYEAVAQVAEGSSLPSGWTVQWLDCGNEWEGAVAACGKEWTVEICSA